MALGKLSSLGVGSNVLNYDTIEKLKQADENAMVKPIDKKLEQGVEKQVALTEVISQLKTLKNETNRLADYSTYLERESSVSGEGVKVTAGAGVPVQDIEIGVKALAKNDINEVGAKFESREAIFSQKNTQLRFHINGRDYDIAIKAGTSLGEVAQMITDKTNGEALGIIMKTGGPRPYSLMINAKDQGVDNEVLFGSTLSSQRILSGSLSLKKADATQSTDGAGDSKKAKDDFTITLNDKNGNAKSIAITLNQTNEDATSQDNAALLRDSIISALKADSDFTQTLPNGESKLIDSIKIRLDSTGERLILNDIRGGEIKLGGAKSGDFGFKKDAETKSDPLIKGTKGVDAGQLKGNLTINGHSIDLESLSYDEASSDENAKAIAEAIDKIEGLSAKVNKDGILEVDSKSGELNLMSINTPTSEEELEAEAELTKDEKDKRAAQKSKAVFDSIGLSAGVALNYSKSYEELWKFKKIQEAADSHFTYNGMEVTRPSNVVDDVIGGVNIELLSPTERPAIVNITQDTTAIKEAVKKFVEVFNEISPKLDELTKYDEDSKVAGVFNGVSDIRMIRPALMRVFSTSVMIDGENHNLVRYGLSVDEKGRMSLDESKLERALSQNPDAAQKFFDGYTSKQGYKEIEVDGIFTQFDKELDRMVGAQNARLKTYEEELTREDKKLREDRKKAMAMLDTRYDLMAQRFAAYDSQIAKTNNAFNSVQMMIDQAAARKD